MLSINERIVRRWARWRGALQSSKPCEICNNPKTQGHHDDYNKPDEVRWLCQRDHALWHKTNKIPPITEETLRKAVLELPGPGRPGNKPRPYKGSLQEAYDKGELPVHPTGR